MISDFDDDDLADLLSDDDGKKPKPKSRNLDPSPKPAPQPAPTETASKVPANRSKMMKELFGIESSKFDAIQN